MMVSGWVSELAAEFWSEAGQLEPFPRHLRQPISRALPLAVIDLPMLGLEAVRAWLRENQVPCPCPAADRALRGCLVAHAGCGFLFLDGTDPEDERRFTLAHELAHFLRDYWQPRRHACRRLGDQILEVFDGRRPASAAERVDALLARLPLGFHVHLLERDACRGLTTEVVRAEEAADLLAYELLAPADMIEGSCRQWQRPIGQVELAEWLRREFGLPLLPARAYAAVLSPAAPATLLQQLGLNS